MHGGLVDPREAGRLGGKARVRNRLGIGGDGELREKARLRLLEAINSPDEKTALAASRAIFSYSSTPAPTPPPAELAVLPRMADGSRPTGIADVIEFAAELGVDCLPVATRDELVQLRAEVDQLRAQLVG
jgi:hypothetical protein